MSRTVVAGALGNCVHVAGVIKFLRMAEQAGYKTHFLGTAVTIDEFVQAVKEYDPEIVGVSYRLTPESAANLLSNLKYRLEENQLLNRKFVFGGTPPVCKVAEEQDLFECCFSGLETEDQVWSYLRGEEISSEVKAYGDTLLERIERKYPYPVLRHHFGLPNLEDTIDGVHKLAESGVLDVISIAPDQNAQEFFFHPLMMDPGLDGAGGVPVRSYFDLCRIYNASRSGNHPLLRIYSGTRDLIEWAQIATETIRNAWAAVPLCWYSSLDGRSERTPEEAIRENQDCMRWYAKRCIPVEVNEPHHWSMRDAHDTISVVTAFLSAYNARKMGVNVYVSQYMFNSPAGVSGKMDLAKMLAQMEVVESLHSHDFVSVRQVRAGLLHLSPKANRAKGQLAASTALALSLKPHIIHVVGYCEGDHAALTDDVIESCDIVHGVINNCLSGMPDMTLDPEVQERKTELLRETEMVLHAIADMGDGYSDPLTNPKVLAKAIAVGILDAPHLKGNHYAAGKLSTRMVNGAVYAVDKDDEHILGEGERLSQLKSSNYVTQSA